jgi:hypothetical protein
MPFDGSELFGTTLDTAALAKQHTGIWWRMRRLARSLVPGMRTAPFGVPANPAMTPEQTTLQVLQLARTLIEDERHWIQRRYETLDGRRCAVGALRSAARLLDLRGQPNGPHNMLLAVAIGRGFTDVEKMNDHSSHGQVLSAFDQAIIRARGQM